MLNTGQRTKGIKILFVLNKMCKKTKIEGNSADNTNIGLLNVSSESIGESLNMEMIIDLVVVIILLMLLMRWIKKCVVRRRLKQRRALTALLHGGQVAQAPPQPAPVPQPLPVVAPPLPAAQAPAPLMIPMGARALPALEYRCAEPKEVWTQA